MTERGQTLDELLSDPMIQIVMASDNVKAEHVRFLLARAHRRSRDGDGIPPAHVIDNAQRLACCNR